MVLCATLAIGTSLPVLQPQSVIPVGLQGAFFEQFVTSNHDTFFAASGEGITAVDIASGATRWTVAVPLMAPVFGASESWLLVVESQSTVYIVNTRTGAFTQTTANGIYGVTAIVATADPNTLVMYAANGNLHAAVSLPSFSFLYISNDDTISVSAVFVPPSGSKYYALIAVDDELQLTLTVVDWVSNASTDVPFVMAVSPTSVNGQIVYVNYTGSVVCVSLEDISRPLWASSALVATDLTEATSVNVFMTTDAAFVASSGSVFSVPFMAFSLFDGTVTVNNTNWDLIVLPASLQVVDGRIFFFGGTANAATIGLYSMDSISGEFLVNSTATPTTSAGDFMPLKHNKIFVPNAQGFVLYDTLSLMPLAYNLGLPPLTSSAAIAASFPEHDAVAVLTFAGVCVFRFD